MAYILNIETSTTNCSVALFNELNLIDCIEENTEDYSHSKSLHVFIDSILKKNKISPKELSAISVGKGPGSYTGLRIGVASAKGLCYALDIPLIALETLEVLSQNVTEKGIAIPCLDARRMEVYSAVFDRKNSRIRDKIGKQWKCSVSQPVLVDCQKDSGTTVEKCTQVKPVLLTAIIFAV